MGTGEHYLIDLIVALPFTLFIYALFCAEIHWSDVSRWTAIAVGLSMTFGLFALSRYATRLFWFSPAIPWSLMLIAVASTLYFKKKLASRTVVAEAIFHA